MDNISNDIDDLVGDAQQYRVVRAELAAARLELAQLSTLYKTSKNIWETSMTEQGRVIAELRAQAVEVVAAFWAWVESNPAKASEFLPAMERLDAAVKALTP